MRIKKILAAAAVTALVCAGGFYALMRSSLPRLTGTARISALDRIATVELDSRGIPRIQAATIEDAFSAQGFLHAQNRFFQMDLARRAAAGELAALVGKSAIDFDLEQRQFRFRHRARELLNTLPSQHVTYLARYTAGVNAGLDDLTSRPPEYWLLRQRPAPWLIEDSVLVVLSLYTMLSNNHDYEPQLLAMSEALAPSVLAFLTPTTSRFDRPVTTRNSNDPSGGYAPMPMPLLSDIGDLMAIDGQSNIIRQPLAPAGSNSWAVTADRTLDGHALVGNDPHLRLRAPNTFYRVELYWPNNSWRGVSIPGIPGVLLGATNNVAWGVTVSYADQSDYVVVERDASNPSRYLVPEGAEAFEVFDELIEVAAHPPVTTQVLQTRWGPIVHRDDTPQMLALNATWLDATGLDATGLDSAGLNLTMLDIHTARTASEAVQILSGWRGPSLNWLVADHAGAIGWTVNGPVPNRRAHDGLKPENWAQENHGWTGTQTMPLIIAATGESLYSANNRQLEPEAARNFSHIAMPPFRANTIAARLDDAEAFDESVSFGIQLDTAVPSHRFLRDIVLATIPQNTTSEQLGNLRELVNAWDGRADTQSHAFAFLDIFYDQLIEATIAPLLAPAVRGNPDFAYRWPLTDEILRRVLEERPLGLLPDPYTNWESFIEEVIAASANRLAALAGSKELSWGDQNRLNVSHPLAQIPIVGKLLRFPDYALPGSSNSVRVATPTVGAVFRMNISPNRPENGIMQLAGGQSGHFLSPHFSDQLEDWALDRPTPFLAGPSKTTFELHPAQLNTAR